MAPPESTTASAELVEAIQVKLKKADGPLKVADVAKGLPKPKKAKAAEFHEEVRNILQEEVRLGRAFSYPSGKKDEVRYWTRDEKHLLREKALELAEKPQSMAALKKELGKVVKGADGAFVEGVVRELIGEDLLFEHPPKGKGGPLFGTDRPRQVPPLEQEKNRKALDKIAESCVKLMKAAGVKPNDLLLALQERLGGTLGGRAEEEGLTLGEEPATEEEIEAAPGRAAAEIETALDTEEGTSAAEEEGPPSAALESLILKAVANSPVVNLAELRGEMPAAFRGKAFDEAVLRLADEGRVVVSQDANLERYSAAERSQFVQDGDALLTTIMRS